MKICVFSRGSIGIAALLAVCSSAEAQLRSFAEAEGFGATVTGARSAPSIYHVTNLADSGSGSFRDAVSASNRIVVFDVGGIINLGSAVSCKSNLTIAGQTAPGGGISLNGAEVSFSSQSNVICRYLHFRPGDGSSSSDDGVAMYDSKNVILDHASIQFAKYDNIDAVTDNGADPNITIQNSIIANGIGQQFGAHLEAVNGHMTLSNNLWANNHNRNPLAKADEQFKGNVLYNNEAGYTTHTSTPFKHDLVNNTFIYGPATNGNSFYQLSSGDTYYATGNVQDSNKDGVLNGSSITPGTGTLVSSANFASTAGLPTLSAADAYQFVIAHAGASLSRDELDSLVLNQVQTLGSGTTGKGVGTSGPTGGLYSSASSDGLSNGGLGSTAAGSRSAGFDADNDGVADAWEAAHGMSASDATDALKLNPLGYLMIEQYINELGSTNDSRTSGGSGNWNSATSWAGGIVPKAMDYALIRGGATSAGSLSISSGSATAMKVSVGGASGSDGLSTGESLTVSGSGSLSVYDTVNVGDQNRGTLNISGGAVSAYNVILGNTLSGVTTNGVINLSGGMLSVSQLVLGGGKPGAWTTGGTLNFTGGTLQAVGSLNVNVPIVLGGTGGVIDSNGYSGVISGVISNSAGSVAGLIKKGTGTITLSRTNTYSGTTIIQAGALIVDGSLAFSPTTITGGTLGGKGTVLSLAATGGSVEPGDSGVGTLTVLGNATLASSLDIDITGSGSGASDVLKVGGMLNIGGTLSFNVGSTLDDATYVLATYGSLSGKFATVSNLPADYSVAYGYLGNSIALVPTSSLPEPAAATVMLALIPALSRRFRKSR